MTRKKDLGTTSTDVIIRLANRILFLQMKLQCKANRLGGLCCLLELKSFAVMSVMTFINGFRVAAMMRTWYARCNTILE